MVAARWVVCLASAWLGTAWMGCGSDAVGVDACRQIDQARCMRAPACGITLEPPYSTSGGDVAACIRFYDDACLHGIENGSQPSPTQLNACLAAINGTGPTGDDCSIVVNPVVASGCSWLTTTTPTADASTDADAAE